MGQQFGPGTRVGKIIDATPVNPELKSRMAGKYMQSLAGASQGMSAEEQNKYLNLARSSASQPVDVRTDEDIEKQQQTQKETGYVA
jgi:hypothetical protein